MIDVAMSSLANSPISLTCLNSDQTASREWDCTEPAQPNGIDALGARIDSAGTAGWHLLDRQGTVISNMSNAGAILNRITYDGFGGIVNQTGSGSQDRYKYTGREQDPDSGYQFHRRRYYDTRTGRWTSRDPISFGAEDPNLYRYVGNNSANAIDPCGLTSKQTYKATGGKAENGTLKNAFLTLEMGS